MEKSDELDDKIFKDTNRVEYSQRHLLQKLESPPD
jgi:hypothetical protein